MDPPPLSKRTRLVGPAVLIALTLLAPAAAAEPSPAERETARTLLISGRAKRKEGKLNEALADFERAHGIMKVPTTGLDLGKAQAALGLLVEARATLLESARYPVAPSEPQAFTRARSEAKQLADEIAPRLPTLTITVAAGARVKVDNVELSAASLDTPLKLNPGKHEIFASIEGDEKRMSVELAERENKSVAIDLHAAPHAAPAAVHEERPAAPPVADRSTKTSPLVWIGLATAGVCAAVGSVTGIMALGVKDDVAAACVDGTKCPPSTHSEIDRGETLGTVSTIAFVVAGVGAAVFVAGLLGAGRAQKTARVEWLLGPANVAGRF